MFDSGFGGLTVARAVMDLLPAEDLVYLGDTGRYPYGPRDLVEVRGFARQEREVLDSQGGAEFTRPARTGGPPDGPPQERATPPSCSQRATQLFRAAFCR